MIRNLFKIKPKWQHKDPAVRRPAIQALTAGNLEELRQILREEAHPDLRRLAVQTLCDLPTLAHALAEDSHAGVRDLALARFRKLLAGQCEPAEAPHLTPEAERLRLLQQSPRAEIAEFVALHAAERAMREAALPLVQRQEILAQVALSDKLAAIRQAAAERLSQREALERVFRESRKRDKQVNRLAKERLDALQAAEQRPLQADAEAERLCARVAALGRSQQWEQDDATLAYLHQQWTRLLQSDGEWVTAGRRERYASARELYLAAAAEYHRDKQTQQHAAAAVERIAADHQHTLGQLEALQQDLKQAGEAPAETLITAFRERLLALHEAWDALEALPARHLGPLQGRYDALSDALGARLQLQAQRRGALGVSEEMADRLRRLLDNGRLFNEKEAQELLGKLSRKAASLPEDGSRQRMQKAEQELTAHLERRLQQQRRQRADKLAQLPPWLDAFEAALDEDDSKQASALHGKIQKGINLLSAAAKQEPGARELERRFKQLLPRFHELCQWRDWAVVNERERLCKEMQDLVGLAVHPTTLAEQIQQLQQEWKHLDSTRAAAPKAIWERFRAASDQAYEPVRAFKQEEAAERERNRHTRAEFIAAQRRYLDDLDWSHVDWKELVKKQRDIRNDWQNLGRVDRKPWRALIKQYGTLMDRFEERLNPERKRCLQDRRNLIARVQALAASDDIPQAIEETKRLQQQWKVTVPADRKAENRLWADFRAACDAVFEHRREAGQARSREERQNLETKQRLCAGIEALQTAALDDLSEARQQLHELQEQWQQAGPVPKRDVSAIEKRYRKALDAFDARKQTLHASKARRDLDRLGEKAALRRRLETLACAGDAEADAITELESQWSALGPLDDGAADQRISDAFAAALSAARGDTEARERLLAAQAANQAKREELCLHMEILAGIDSPPEAQEARMAYQVERLSEAMHQGKPEPAAEAQTVAQAWCFTGAGNTGAEQALEERFRRALNAMEPESAAAGERSGSGL